jgi:hypothetical protein
MGYGPVELLNEVAAAGVYRDEVHPWHEVALKQPRLSFRDRHEHDGAGHEHPFESVDTSLPSSAKR